MKKLLFFAAALSAFMTACTSEDEIFNQNVKVATTLTATISQDGQTRVALGTSDGSSTPLTWEADDAILVKNNTSATVGKFTTDATSDPATFTISEGEALVEDEAHTALYPYTAWSADGTTFTFPATQTYTAGTVDKSALPMIATNASGTDFTFSAGAAVLRLRVKSTTSSSDVSLITINSVAHNLVGAATLTGTTLGAPTGAKSVSLSCSSRVSINNSTAVDFYMVIPAGTYEANDLTITVNQSLEGKCFYKKSKAAATFAAGKVYNIDIVGTPEPIETIDLEEINTKIAANKTTLKTITFLTGQKRSNSTYPYWYAINSENMTFFTTNDKFVFSDVQLVSMFEGCSSLTSLDLSNFDTSNVSSLRNMFWGCSSLTSLNLSSFNTENVQSMQRLFSGCNSLTSLDLSNFNTSKVKNMACMFEECKLLTALDLSNFNTENVTEMQNMFSDCFALTTSGLNISSFVTTKVTNMQYMFAWCKALTSIDLTHFDTSNVTKMQGMFEFCDLLTNPIISSFNTEKVTTMESMFRECKALTSLNLSHFKTSSVTNTSLMFDSCILLSSLTLSNNFSFAANTNRQYMFDGCGQNAAGGPKFIIYGVTDEGIKTAIRGEGTSVLRTYWDGSYQKFDGE